MSTGDAPSPFTIEAAEALLRASNPANVASNLEAACRWIARSTADDTKRRSLLLAAKHFGHVAALREAASEAPALTPEGLATASEPSHSYVTSTIEASTPEVAP